MNEQILDTAASEAFANFLDDPASIETIASTLPIDGNNEVEDPNKETETTEDMRNASLQDNKTTPEGENAAEGNTETKTETEDNKTTLEEIVVPEGHLLLKPEEIVELRTKMEAMQPAIALGNTFQELAQTPESRQSLAMLLLNGNDEMVTVQVDGKDIKTHRYMIVDMKDNKWLEPDTKIAQDKLLEAMPDKPDEANKLPPEVETELQQLRHEKQVREAMEIVGRELDKLAESTLNWQKTDREAVIKGLQEFYKDPENKSVSPKVAVKAVAADLRILGRTSGSSSQPAKKASPASTGAKHQDDVGNAFAEWLAAPK